jgi:hypothetical protein
LLPLPLDNMSTGDDEDLWDSWTSRSEAAIVLDGRKLNDVFTAIRSQLEFLRRQQQTMSDQMGSFYYHNPNDTRESLPQQHEPVNNFAQELQSSSSPSQSFANVKSSFAMAQAPPPPVLDAEELKIILDRIHALETDVRKHDAFGERIDRLEANMNAKFSGLQTQMEKLTARVEANSATSMLHEKMFADLEEKLQGKISSLSNSVDDKLGVIQQTTDESFRENETTVHTLRDLVQVNELRLKKVEKEGLKNSDHCRELQETIDYFPVKYLDNIRNDIVELYMVKASKDDLGHKFDTAQAHKKADQEEVVRLEQHAIELTRRLDLLTKELHDGFGTVDAKLEKRIDKVAHWCLKHLRKEMRERNFENGEDPREGTDIGRVKCLVCDQVVVQQRETDIVHGGPPMKNVIKPHHIQPGQQTRPRSASPPGTRGRGYGTGTTPQVPESATKKLATANTAPGTLPAVNTGKQQTATTHSKLVKLGAQPIVGASNPAGSSVPADMPSATQHTNTSAAATGFSDDVDPAEDFNYRVEADTGSPQRRSPNPAEESPIRIAQAAPVHSRDPAHMATSASQPAQQQQVHQFHVQQDNANYFRDLEE